MNATSRGSIGMLLVMWAGVAGGWAAPPASRGAAPDQAIVEPPPERYAPRSWGDDLVDYDLAANGHANAFVKGFMDAYHPGVEFTWRRPTKSNFGFVGTRRPDDQTLQMVYMGWHIWNDGCNWKFSETELTRHMGYDPFEIVPDAEARGRIKDALGPEVVARPCDVFRQRSREVFTGTDAPLSFGPAELSAPQYGVFIDGRVRYFDAAGDPL